MTESFAVEAALEWKTNVPVVLRQMMAGFEEVNRVIADLRENLSALGSDSRGLGALGRQMEKLKVPTGVLDGMRELRGVTGGLAETQRAMAESAKETVRAWRDLAQAGRQVRLPRAPVGGPGGATRGARNGHGHVSAMDAAMGAQMAGDAGMGLFERGFHAYADVQLQQVMAQSDKLVTDAVMQRANSLIATLQKTYPALTQAEGLTLFRNSMGIFGNPNESLEALPGAVRLQQLYQLAPLGKGGTGGSEVQAAEKAGDALQSFINPTTHKLDTGLYQQFMDFQARSYQAGGGLVDAKGWLSFARTSRSAGISLSPHALEETQALLEMSPGRTGTALMSAFQVFGASTRHMAKGNKAAWGQAGLLDKKNDIIDRQLYQSDPFEWVWKDMLPALKKHGVQTRDQILRWLTENGQRGTVAGLLADIAIGQTPISNTAAKMERQDPNLVDKLVVTDAGKLAALNAAETNFFVALGKFAEGPGLSLITKLTDALNYLTEEADKHPQAAARLIEVGGGLALVSKVAGDTAMASIFVGGPLVRGVGALARGLLPFGQGAAADAALTTLGGVGAGSLAGLAGGILALAGTVIGLPPLLKWGLDHFPGGTPTGGKTAPTHGGGAFTAPATSESWGELWRGLQDSVDASGHPGANMRSGAANATIHNTMTGTVNLDGKKVGTFVAKSIASSLTTQAGPTAGDSRAVPTPAGATGQ